MKRRRRVNDPEVSWLTIDEAYALRNKYPEEVRHRIVEMMRKERIFRAQMRRRYYLTGYHEDGNPK